jgi:NAD(P)-dependent dehydrogenase (short-subunit alcohol dehydrogenase family)
VVASTVQMFGGLHAVVNNAGILRDRVLVNMDESDWDAVVRVHLGGTFAMTRWAADYWRRRVKAGEAVDAAVVNTSSTSGIFGNPGQANYGAAKAGVACFSIIAALELQRYGVRVNCIAPAARTRLTEATPGLDEAMKAPQDRDAFDEWDPANVSPLVAYLVSPACSLTGQTFAVMGGLVQRLQPWSPADFLKKDGRWTVAELEAEMPALSVGEWADPSRVLGV